MNNSFLSSIGMGNLDIGIVLLVIAVILLAKEGTFKSSFFFFHNSYFSNLSYIIIAFY